MADTKFSQFAGPSALQSGDIIVGLRSGVNEQFSGPVSPSFGGTGVDNTGTITLGGNLTTSGAYNSVFTMTGATSVTFPTSGTLATVSEIGVTSITGTANQVIASASTGAVTLSLPQSIATTSAVTFATIQTSDFLDTNSNIAFQLTPIASAVNYLYTANSATGNPVTLSVDGTDANVGLLIETKGTSPITLWAQNTTPLVIVSGALSEHTTNFAFPNTSDTQTVTFQDASGTVAYTSQIPTGAALTKVNDTNVTLTLGGTPSTALLEAVSITAGWTGTLAITRGGTGSSSVISTPTATSWAGWDANKNMSANNFISGYTSTPTAGGTTSLTSTSTYQQYFTGTMNQTVEMPATSGLVVGQQFNVVNTSTLAITAAASDGSTIVTMAANSYAILTCISTSITTSAAWVAEYNAGGVGVTSITGTANQVIASASTGAVTLSLPQSIATTSAVQFGSVQTPLILDSNAADMVHFTTSGSAVNYFNLTNAVTTAAPVLAVTGSDTNINFSLQTKGTGIYSFFSNNNTPVEIFSGTAYQHVTEFAFANTNNTRTVTFPDSSGTLAYTSQLPSPAALTANNDTNVTLTLGGTPSGALLEATSITAGWTGTLAVGRGGTGISSISANELLYSSAANTIAGLATANNSGLITNGSGVPGWVATTGTTNVVLSNGPTITSPTLTSPEIGYAAGQAIYLSGATSSISFVMDAEATGNSGGGFKVNGGNSATNQVAWITTNQTDGAFGNILQVDNATGVGLVVNGSRMVGVNQSTPAYNLDVVGNSSFISTASTGEIALLINNNSNTAAGVYIDGFGGSAGVGTIYRQVNDTSPTVIQFLNAAQTPIGSITTTSSATAYNTSSDYRLKENVLKTTGMLDAIKKIQIKNYNFIADPETTYHGVLAHELQETDFSYAVYGDKDALNEDGSIKPQSVDMSKLVGPLVAALQELSIKVDSLMKNN